jgi:G3E family GTPase
LNRRLPVTLVGGFLGAGKTSLLHHLISEHRGGHLAVLVENPGPLNLDARALRGLCGAMRRTNDTVFEIPDGDEAAQLEWIAARLREFSQAGRYERVLIELAGTSSPSWLARRFGLAPDVADSFSTWAELQQTLCVVDALDYLRAGTGPASGAEIWDFQNEQLAGASLVVLNKCDLLEEKQRDFCLRAIHDFHPGARIFETAYGEVPVDVWARPAKPSDPDSRAERKPASLSSGPSIRETSAAPLSWASALYRTHRPFHPQRFWDWFNADHPGLLRVKGVVWLATRNLLVGGVSRTRWQNACGAAGIWWAALPREEWPQEPEALMRMQETWREPYGDRRQELVLIGDADALSSTTRRELDACLLTDPEFARPVKEWAVLADPFPLWDLEES